MIPFAKSAAHWRCLFRACVLAAAVWTSEACAETYVILPLVGDHLTIVGQRRQSGQPLDANEKEVMPLPAPGFDGFAVKIADATIANVRPDAGVVTISVNDPTLRRISDSWLDADLSGVEELVGTIKKQLPALAEPRLLLVVPYRDQIDLRTMYGKLGSGKASGLGFYIDATTRLRRSDTLEGGRGFMGAFANFQLVLVNLQTGAVEGHERVVIGTTYSSARGEDKAPRDALTDSQKTKAIESLLKQGIEESLPKMLGTAKR